MLFPICNYQPEYTNIELTLLVASACPKQIVINDSELKQVAYAHQLGLDSWYFDVENKQVHLKLDQRFWRKDIKLLLNFEQSMVISMDD